MGRSLLRSGEAFRSATEPGYPFPPHIPSTRTCNFPQFSFRNKGSSHLSGIHPRLLPPPFERLCKSQKPAHKIPTLFEHPHRPPKPSENPSEEIPEHFLTLPQRFQKSERISTDLNRPVHAHAPRDSRFHLASGAPSPSSIFPISPHEPGSRHLPNLRFAADTARAARAETGEPCFHGQPPSPTGAIRAGELSTHGGLPGGERPSWGEFSCDRRGFPGSPPDLPFS